MSVPGPTRRPRPYPARRAPAWTRFVRRYGWRAYAVPVLAVVTVVALVRGTPDHPHHTAVSRTGAGPVASAGGHRAVVEGTPVAGFRAGSTPAPVVVTLRTDTTSCATNGYSQLIIVSISQQHLWACAHNRQVDSSPVTTGSLVHHDQTPFGSWRVQGKQRDRYLVGPGYRDYVHFWVPFNGDFGLHDAPWQTMPFGSAQWRTRGSHGCVHVPEQTMQWLYDWATVGTTVVTVER